MKYNYIFVCSGVQQLDMDGYYAICAKDMENCSNIHLVYDVVDRSPKLIRSLYKLHTSKRINSVIKLPFQNLWFPYYFKNPFNDNKPLCIVFQNWALPPSYFNYIEKKYPGVKKVKIHRDLISKAKKAVPWFTEEFDKRFDLSFTYDKGDAAKYGYLLFDEYESLLTDIHRDNNYPECDVFFAGVVKDRLPKLMTVYNKLTAAGLIVHYYLLGVPDKDRVPFEGITYADKGMSYREMLYHSVNCRCLLDINQEGAEGFTSRILEAIMYNKPLIADNPNIKSLKYYNPDFIQIYTNWDNLDPCFVMKDENRVNYHYDGDFSPLRLIEKIDLELSKLS